MVYVDRKVDALIADDASDTSIGRASDDTEIYMRNESMAMAETEDQMNQSFDLVDHQQVFVTTKLVFCYIH